MSSLGEQWTRKIKRDVVANFVYYSVTCLEELQNIHEKTSQENQAPGRDLKPGSQGQKQTTKRDRICWSFTVLPPSAQMKIKSFARATECCTRHANAGVSALFVSGVLVYVGIQPSVNYKDMSGYRQPTRSLNLLGLWSTQPASPETNYSDVHDVFIIRRCVSA